MLMNHLSEKQAPMEDLADPAFRVPVWRALKPAGDMACEANADYLAHWLARHPDDLFRHVQRVRLHVALGDAEQAYAALVDLFIALGDKGRPLRERMAGMVGPLLSAERREAVANGLDAGIPRIHRLGDIPGSVLGHPVRGRQDMVLRRARNDTGRTFLAEARALIEDNLIDEARALLERALLDNPDDAELAEELTTLYRATRDTEAYAAMWRRLWQLGRLPAAWDKEGATHAG